MIEFHLKNRKKGTKEISCGLIDVREINLSARSVRRRLYNYYEIARITLEIPDENFSDRKIKSIILLFFLILEQKRLQS